MCDKIKCKDLLNCERVDCPAYDADTFSCWLTEGTRCHDQERGTFLSKVELCLEAMARMIGYSVAEMIGMHHIDAVAPEDRKMVAERYRRRQAGEKVARSYEFRLLHKDGSTRLDVNMQVGIISYQNRVVTIATIKDMTASKQAEIERQKMAEKLEQSKKMEAIGTLAGGVAHDLNNILSGVVSYPELLLMDLPDDSPLKGPILTIQKSGERAAAIVQDLLTLARRGVSTMETIDLNQIASAMLGKLGYAAVTVSSGEAAVAYLKDHDVDLVLLDMIMAPGIDGLETYRRIAAFKPGLKAVIASGYSETERVKALQHLGVKAYVKKPYTLDRIGTVIKQTLCG